MFHGKQIRDKRRSLNLSAEQLAVIIGVNKNNLYKWEKGHRPQDPEDYIKIESWLKETAQKAPNGDALNKSTDKLTTVTKTPAFEMKPSNGNSDKDAVIKSQSDTVKTLADTTKAQQETISKLTDLVTKLVKE